MWRSAAVVVVMSGCASSPTEMKPRGPAVDPRTCVDHFTLTAEVSATAMPVGPYLLDENGVDLCVHLDSPQIAQASFVMSTPPVPGTHAAVAGQLEDAAYKLILIASDTTVGLTDPQTSTRVEWDPPTKKSTDVVVWVWGASDDVMSTVSLQLVIPID